MELENRMGRLLQAGVTAAAAVMIAGGVLYLKRHAAEVPDYTAFHGVAAEFRSVAGILGGTVHLQARAIIQLGVLLMIATPVMRVAFAIVAFAMERDWLYTAVSAIVMGVLVYALWGMA